MITFEQVRLGDLASAVILTRGFPTARARHDGDVRVMSVAALRTGGLPKLFADRAVMAEIEVGSAQPADVLIAIEGGTVGQTLVVPQGTDEFVPSQQVATLRVIDPSRLDPWYLGAWLTTQPVREQVLRLARGVTIQRIPIRDLWSLTVRVLPLADQRRIGHRFMAFDNAIRSHHATIGCLEELRNLDLVMAFASSKESQ